MALFNRKKDTDKQAADTTTVEQRASATPKKTSGKAAAPPRPKNLARILRRPHITEKASWATVKNVFVFEVPQDATKSDIKGAIEQVYNITPRKVNVVRMRPRKVRKLMRRQRGQSSGSKKAYVYLKEGDRIELA